MKYDWTQAPEGAVAGVRDENGEGCWVVARLEPGGGSPKGFWVPFRIPMPPSAILDNSRDWRDSMELRPVEVRP